MTNAILAIALILSLAAPPTPPLAIAWYSLFRAQDGTITAIVTHSGGWLVTISCITGDGSQRGAGGGEVAPYPDRQAFVFAERPECSPDSAYIATIMRREPLPAVSTPPRIPDRPIFLPLVHA